MSGQKRTDGWWQDDKGNWHQSGQPPRPSTQQPEPAVDPAGSEPASGGGPDAISQVEAAPAGKGRLDVIVAQIAHLPGGKGFLGRKEVKQLPTILWEDEKVENIIRGFYANGTGILVATNKRLVFVDKGLAKLRVEDFPYDKITSTNTTLGSQAGRSRSLRPETRLTSSMSPKSSARRLGISYGRA
jgi:Bacterial PH domain